MIGNVIGPLIVWQLKKDLDPFVDQQGKEALNFQITFSIVMIWALRSVFQPTKFTHVAPLALKV